MATEFKKLSEVTTLEEAAETAYVLIEENGEIYRVPKTAVGGAGGIKTAIIRDSGYLNAIAGVSTMTSAAPAYTYECINMTFEEAYETMAQGEPLMVVGMFTTEGATCLYGEPTFTGTAMGVQCIMLMFYCNMMDSMSTLYWTAEGLSTEQPSSK